MKKNGFINYLVITVLTLVVMIGASLYNNIVKESSILTPVNNTNSQNSSTTSQNKITQDTTTKTGNPQTIPSQNNASQTTLPNVNSSKISFSDLGTNGSADVKINPNSKIGYNIQISSGAPAMLLAGWSGAGLSVVLTDPKGNIINLTANNPNSVLNTTNPMFYNQAGKYFLSYTFPDQATSGIWKLVIANSSANIIDFGIQSAGGSDIMVVPENDVIYSHTGMDFILSAGVGEKLPDNSMKMLTDMNVKADIVGNNNTKTVQLFDDNFNGVGIPNDGVYDSRTISDLSSGDYQSSYTVVGKDPAGNPVNIKGNGTDIIISSDDASILGDPIDEGLDTVGNGMTTVIQIKIWFSPKVAGKYILAGTFVSPSGQEIRKANDFSSDGSGPMQVTLLLDTSGLGNGMYKLKDIQLFEDNGETKWVDSYVGGNNGDGVYVTKNYTVK